MVLNAQQKACTLENSWMVSSMDRAPINTAMVIVYKGSFLKGCKYGAGVITSHFGKYVISGIFEKDKWVEGTKEYSDGTPSLIMIRSIL